jgi:hypothetical protein
VDHSGHKSTYRLFKILAAVTRDRRCAWFSKHDRERRPSFKGSEKASGCKGRLCRLEETVEVGLYVEQRIALEAWVLADHP